MTKYKFIRQHDSMQCGAACLAMICHFHGKKIPVGNVEALCGSSKDGVSLKALSSAANDLGFQSACAYLSITDLEEIDDPIILLWNQNHYVVLYDYDKNKKKFIVADPANGICKFSTDEITKYWIVNSKKHGFKGIAMILNPSSSFEESDNNENAEGKSFSLILDYVLKYKQYFLNLCLGLLVGCLLQLAIPFLTQSIVDIGIKHKDIGFIWMVLIGESMIVIGRMFNEFVRRWLLLHISMRINITLLSDFVIKLLKLPMSFFDYKMLGDIQQRLNDHNRIQSFLTNQLINMTFAIFNLLLFGIVLLVYNRLIFIIYVVCSMLYCVWLMMFLEKRKRLDYDFFRQQANNNTLTYQLISCMQEIKLQGCERRRRWEWEDVQADAFLIQMKTLRMQQIQESGSAFINELKSILITIFSASSVISGDLTLGGMMAIQYVIGLLNSPIEQLMFFIYYIQDVKISLDRINDIHNRKDEDENVEKKITSFEKGKKQDIIFKDVSFKYDTHNSSFTLSNLSFVIPEGKVTAIVGESGSGKTTIIKLILGFYRVTKGNIIIASHDISEYNLKWWRSHTGTVMQEGVIFSESIERNIAIGDCEIDTSKVKEAAQIACIDSYINKLPLNYSTKLGKDGAGLSKGQKQRILIARAVYKNPEFLFLDEATNSLDASNEKSIVENLSQFYSGKTVVIVAHRLSTVKNADQIIVIEKGRIVENGNHNSLIKLKGKYYDLIKNQLELDK